MDACTNAPTQRSLRRTSNPSERESEMRGGAGPDTQWIERAAGQLAGGRRRQSGDVSREYADVHACVRTCVRVCTKTVHINGGIETARGKSVR